MDRMDHVALCIEKGWGLVAGLLAALAYSLSSPAPLSGTPRHEALSLLRLAEAMVRRLLMLMARGLQRPYAQTAREPRPLPDFSSFAKARDPLARFAATEPLARYPAAAPETGPRIRCLNLAEFAPSAQKMGKTEAQSPVLKARLQALQNIVRNPKRQASRMARWLTKAEALWGKSPGRFRPIRPGYPPGYSKRRRRRDPVTLGALMDLDYFAKESRGLP